MQQLHSVVDGHPRWSQKSKHTIKYMYMCTCTLGWWKLTLEAMQWVHQSSWRALLWTMNCKNAVCGEGGFPWVNPGSRWQDYLWQGLQVHVLCWIDPKQKWFSYFLDSIHVRMLLTSVTIIRSIWAANRLMGIALITVIEHQRKSMFATNIPSQWFRVINK